MRHRFNSTVRSWRAWVWFALYASLLIEIVIPFLRWNIMVQWDAPGHLNSAWYIRHYLWPWPVGWSHMFFTGFPQGTFYPPLFHYLVAAVSFVCSIQNAAKIVTSVGILLAPIAFYRYVRSLNFSPFASVTTMLLMLALLIFPFSYSSSNNAIGGTMYSTFNVGLLTNSFVLPLVFFYFAALHSRLLRGRSMLASLLLSAIVLTHVYAAMVAIAYFIIFGVVSWKDRGVRRHLVMHVVISLALTAWWWVPFVRYYSASATIGLPLVLGAASFLVLGGGIIAALWLIYRHRIGRVSVPIWFLLFATVAVVMMNVLHWPIHTYRLILYPFLLLPIVLLHICTRKSVRWVLLVVALVAIGYGYLRIEKTPGFSVRGPQRNFQQQPILGTIPDRVMVLSGIFEQFNPHINQFTWPMRTNNAMAKGLFVESSLTARYLQPLENLIDPTSFIWGIQVAQYQPMTNDEIRRVAERRLKDFGISSLVSARSLTRYGWKAERPLTEYQIAEEQFEVQIGQHQYAVPRYTSSSYFAVSKDKFVFVVQESEQIRFRFFSMPKLGEQNVFTVDQTTYFVRKVYDDVYDVEFALNTNQVLIKAPDALGPLDAFTDSLPEDQRDAYRQAVRRIASQVSQVSASQAQVAYRDVPRQSLVQGNEQQFRKAEARTVSAPRVYRFFLYSFPEEPIVVPLKKAPEAVGEKWQENVDQWFYQDKDAATLVHTSSTLPSFVPGKVEKIEASQRQDRIMFTVDAPRPSPVVVHVSYFPRWRAYLDGKPIPIYQASPNQIVLYGQGNIVIQYSAPLFERIASGISFTTLLFLLIFRLREAVLRRRRAT